jgi:dihydropteroate synthase
VNRDDFGKWMQKWGRVGDPHNGARPLVMGVLNVTPDSFSDGGRYFDPGAAVAHAEQLVSEGADLLDVGGESTRPGAQRVEAAEQLRRILPVLSRIAELPVTISVDTTLSEVARAAVDHGAHVINDISAGRDDPQMFPLAAKVRKPIVLMHMLGQPATMQDAPTYTDVVAEVSAFLQERMAAAESAGITRDNILLDPGIGFGKQVHHNLTLIRDLSRFTALGRPLVVGTSRKRFIGRITGETTPADRVIGTAASVAWTIANGAAVVRVHDVRPMVQVARLVRAIRSGEVPDEATR